jgi:hypothetical protein
MSVPLERVEAVFHGRSNYPDRSAQPSWNVLAPAIPICCVRSSLCSSGTASRELC